MIRDLVNDRSGGGEVPEVGLDFRLLVELALGFEVVWDPGHDVASGGGLGLVLELGLGLVQEGADAEAQAGRAAVV